MLVFARVWQHPAGVLSERFWHRGQWSIDELGRERRGRRIEGTTEEIALIGKHAKSRVSNGWNQKTACSTPTHALLNFNFDLPLGVRNWGNQRAAMCKEKHTNLACGCTEFSGILNCPLLFRGCMGPRGEQDRVYDDADEPCELCRQNGWNPIGKEKEKSQVQNVKGDSDKSSDSQEKGRPAKRKRDDYERDEG